MIRKFEIVSSISVCISLHSYLFYTGPFHYSNSDALVIVEIVRVIVVDRDNVPTQIPRLNEVDPTPEYATADSRETPTTGNCV